MSTAIATVDSIQDKIRNRIRESFVELIPEEAWKELVAKEIKDFTTNSANQFGPPQPSPLRQMVRAEVERECKKKLAEAMQGAEWQETFNPSGPNRASAAVKEIVRQNLPEMVEAAWGMIVQTSVDRMKSELATTYR